MRKTLLNSYFEVDSQLSDISFSFYKNKRDTYCDNIITFDIETTNAFVKDGIAYQFDKTKDAKFWDDYEKCSICYIWQLGIVDIKTEKTNVFYGRTLESFIYFLLELSEITQGAIKIIYVHNLAFEFQFLINVMKEVEVFARRERHPYYFRWENFEFRCSYMLTRLSIEKWAISKKLNVKKMVGDLDYSKLRTPKTHLSSIELEYCFNDVRVPCEGLKEYKERFKHIVDIPLTQTGVVRKECSKIMRSEISYCRLMSSIYPDTVEEMQILINIFWGGITHANMISSCITLLDVGSFDITSSYPWVLVSEKYPMTKFVKVNDYENYLHDNRYCYIITIKCTNLDTKISHTFLSKSKCEKIVSGVYDNGRLISANEIIISMTNIDYEMFKQSYNYEKIEVLDFYISRLGYLNRTFILYILTLFVNKTKYKGLEEFKSLYAKSKEELNSLFGMCVTRDITDEVFFDNGQWYTEYLTKTLFETKVIKKKRNLRKNFITFSTGVWCTAYARRNLWLGVLNHGDDIAYMDTDSHKVENYESHEKWYLEYNFKVEEKQKEIAKRLNVSLDMFRPISPKGKVSSLGTYEFEDVYKKFKTLGAKKYIYEDDNNILHMTVSGVRKSAVLQISSIDEFESGLVFDIDHAKKLLMHYNDNQPEFIINNGRYDRYKCNYQYGICAQNTTYSLRTTDEYEELLENIGNITELFKRKGLDL